MLNEFKGEINSQELGWSESDRERENRERERREQISKGIWRPKIFDSFENVVCGASTKEYKGFIYLRNPQRFEEEMKADKIRAGKNLVLFIRNLDPSFDPHRIAYPELEHTDNIRLIRPPEIMTYIKGRKKILKTDGLITEERGIVLAILGADCPSVGIFDSKNNAIGVFHSGWRGTSLNIAGKGVREMRRLWESDVKFFYAVIGPGISENYEVGEDVLSHFREHKNFSEEELKGIFMPKGEGKYSLNLHKAILLELLKAGIPRGNIEVTSLRTDLDNDLFPSFRLEGEKADRFMFAMGLK